MRILHLCLACFYIDNYNYQENVLPRIDHEKGNTVRIIASTETYINDQEIGYLEPKEYVTEYGVQIKRVPYYHLVNDTITHKMRLYIGLYAEIEKFKPDLIFSHDLSFLSVLDVVRYVKRHPNVTFLADTHTAYYNSGLNWLSKNVLHRLIYRTVIQRSLPYVKRYYYIGPSERDYSTDVYGVPPSLMEYLPLGGVIPDTETRTRNRLKIRERLKLKDDELLLLHSGKLDEKKRTSALLSGFSQNSRLKARLVIIGSISEGIRESIESLISADSRIMYLGWMQSKDLLEYLCACDLYCQPGSPSATLQNAICSGCAIMAQEMDGYKLLNMGNFIWVDTEESIKDAFSRIAEGDTDIEQIKQCSMKCAEELLDYYKMEEKIRAQAVGNGQN